MPKRVQSFDPRQNMLGLQMEAFHNYDDADRVVDLHHHDFYEIYYFISGDVEYRVEGKNYVLQKGDLLLISPGVFHQPVVRPGTPYERIVLWINRGYLAQFAEQGVDLSTCFDPYGAVLLQPLDLGGVQPAAAHTLPAQHAGYADGRALHRTTV